MTTDEIPVRPSLHEVVAGAVGGAIRLFLALCLVALLWLALTATLVYLTLTSPAGSFTQALSSHIAVTLLLAVASPVLFEFWRVRTTLRLGGSLLGAGALIAIASRLTGGVQALVLGTGCGIALLFILDFWLRKTWADAIDRANRRIREAHADSTIVLGY